MTLRVALFGLLLAGCATTGAYETILQRWVGVPADDLVKAWGPPRAAYSFADGRQTYRYVRARAASVPAARAYRPVVIPDNRSPSGVRTAIVEERIGDPAALPLYCETTFEIDAKGIVRGWKWHGNDCAARPE